MDCCNQPDLTPSNSSAESLPSVDASIEESLDEIEARKTALRFLCVINADFREIERFLATYPEALLFASDDDSDLEEGILDDMKCCTCFGSSCNQNRQNILKVVRRGFEFYRGLRLVSTSGCDFFEKFRKSEWEMYSKQLRDLERDMRILKSQEEVQQDRKHETMRELSNLRMLLEQALKRLQRIPIDSPFARLRCRKVRNMYNERASLENKLALASARASLLEKEQKILQVEKATAIRLQRALLKKSFLGIKRHMCSAMKLDF
jgi:hypothetical protein